MKVGNRIVELRKKSGLSQEELADKVGVARQTISKWELGETSPDLNQANELSKIFNVSIDELVNNKKISNNNYLYVTIIVGMVILGIVIIVVVLMNKREIKCKDDNSIIKTTIANTKVNVTKSNFIITKTNGCVVDAYITNDSKKTPYVINYCDMDGSADMHYNVGDEIWLKYSEVQETYPLQINHPLELDTVKKN